MAEAGQDVSQFFTNTGRMNQPVQRVNVDFTSPMLRELDEAASELNVSRQALIKSFLRQALDQHYLARRARKTG
jgi:metal-responsive CopG/Arc/MetJ family transcriptional regulator